MRGPGPEVFPGFALGRLEHLPVPLLLQEEGWGQVADGPVISWCRLLAREGGLEGTPDILCSLGQRHKLGANPSGGGPAKVFVLLYLQPTLYGG